MGYLSADAVGSTLSWVSCDFSMGADRRGTERGNPLAQRRADPLLLGPAGAGHAQASDWLGRAKGHRDRMDPGDATPTRQRLERALDKCRDGRGAAAQQQLSYARQNRRLSGLENIRTTSPAQ